jgi:hypothetical protein
MLCIAYGLNDWQSPLLKGLQHRRLFVVKRNMITVSAIYTCDDGAHEAGPDDRYAASSLHPQLPAFRFASTTGSDTFHSG